MISRTTPQWSQRLHPTQASAEEFAELRRDQNVSLFCLFLLSLKMKKVTTDDIEALCLPIRGAPGREALAELAARPKQRFAKKDGFFISRMPLRWALAATYCGLEAVKVSYVLWIRMSITKNLTVEFSLRQIGEMVNVNKSNVRRALLRLDRAGLVVVHRQPRRRLKVTIVVRAQLGEGA